MSKHTEALTDTISRAHKKGYEGTTASMLVDLDVLVGIQARIKELEYEVEGLYADLAGENI